MRLILRMTTQIAAAEKGPCGGRKAFAIRKPIVMHPNPQRNMLTKFLNTICFRIPIGYQDETGFHYGEEPARRHVRYLADW